MMRKSITLFFVFFVFVLSGLSVAQDNSREIEANGNAVFTLTNPTGWVYDSPDAVLFDNGPYFNSPGGGPGGADGSVLQTSLGMSTLGAGHQFVNLNRVADDFTIPSGETWTINTASFYAYQTGSTTTSTITAVNVRIWDGPPGIAGSSVIFGDSTTNVMVSTEFTNCYRYSESAVGTTRPIMKQTTTIGTTLSEGTYWIDWQSAGTLASGPWAPPIAIIGQTTTGNARQGIAGVWADVVDGGTLTGMGFPFILDGTSGNPNTFFDNFDSYIAGQQLACQDSINWTTWSFDPCNATEDAYISSNYAYSGANSCVIVQNNDLVKLHGSKTTGRWFTSLLIYIPTGKSGYFNQMSGFTPNAFQWAMECYFDAGGGGRFVADATTNFTWLENTWQQALVVVDLDTHVAEFWFGTTNPLTMIYTWDWTRGGTIVNRIDANDFFGATANDEMYMDNYYFSDQMPVILPVELSAFSANVNNRNVVLNWTTETEINNQGFEIERRSDEGQFVTIGHVSGNGTTTERKQYSFTDVSLEAGNYFYRLKQIDFNGTFEYSNEVSAEIVAAPVEFALNQNYPNPFNPTTSINFSLAEPTFVKLAVYNLLGEEVQVLKNEYMDAGSFEVNFDAASIPSGMYLYKIETAQFTSVRKMMLMK